MLLVPTDKTAYTGSGSEIFIVLKAVELMFRPSISEV